MNTNSTPPSEKVVPIQNHLKQWSSRVRSVQSPEEAFQAKLEAARAVYDDKVRSSSSRSVAPGDRDTFRARRLAVSQCIQQVDELEAEHEAKKDDEEYEYQEKFARQYISMVLDLFSILGPSISDRSVVEWRNRVAQPSSASLKTQLDPITEQAETRPEEDVQQIPIADQPLTRQTTDQPIPDMPSTENERDQPIDSVPPTHQRKRATSPLPTVSEASKRARPNTLSEPLTNKVIDFDQVFQNGNARTKYVIQRYQGYWYIVECKAHKKQFLAGNPLHGARRHLQGVAHHSLSVGHQQVIRMLGTRVLDCDDGLAEKNNKVARMPSYVRASRPQPRTCTFPPQPSGTQDPEYDAPQTRNTHNRIASHIVPKPGEVYTTFWKSEKRFYAVLILPWGSFREFGWDMSLKHTGLLNKIPACYKYDPVSETAEWAEAYKPGGPSALKRRYPVMYFDEPEVPKSCRSGWVAVANLQPYDSDDNSIPYKDKVDEFLNKYRNYREDSPRDLRRQTEMNMAAAASRDDAPESRIHSPQMQLAIQFTDMCEDSESSENEDIQTYQSSIGPKEHPTNTNMNSTTDRPMTQVQALHQNNNTVQGDEQPQGSTDLPNEWLTHGHHIQQTNTADSDVQPTIADAESPIPQAAMISSSEYLAFWGRAHEPTADPRGSNTLRGVDKPVPDDNAQGGPSQSLSKSSSASNDVVTNAMLRAYSETSMAYESLEAPRSASVDKSAHQQRTLNREVPPVLSHCPNQRSSTASPAVKKNGLPPSRGSTQTTQSNTPRNALVGIQQPSEVDYRLNRASVVYGHRTF
ncbi:hypothetical protein HG530_008420 [Fusarium avenaceum]|nr:hypothetical protein HG530_008420 [Fusarium avenaceum]